MGTAGSADFADGADGNGNGGIDHNDTTAHRTAAANGSDGFEDDDEGEEDRRVFPVL